MTLLYLLSFVGFFVQICFITLSIGKNPVEGPSSLIIFKKTSFSCSGWPLLSSRVSGRVHSNGQKSDNSFDRWNYAYIRVIYIFRSFTMVHGIMWTVGSTLSRSHYEKLSVRAVHFNTFYGIVHYVDS